MQDFFHRWSLTGNKAFNQNKMKTFYSRFIRNGDLCFDVGAHRGTRTAVFLQLGAKVVCVEPQDSCFSELSGIFGTNSDVILIKKGLAEEEGIRNLHICRDETAISTMSDAWMTEGRFSKDFRWDSTQRVPVTTLDELIRLFGMPKFCKIDAEGCEYPILKGLTQPVPSLSFEFTREFFKEAIKCIHHLLSLGDAGFNCSLAESYQLLFPGWKTPEELFDVLGSFEEQFLWGDIYVTFCPCSERS